MDAGTSAPDQTPILAWTTQHLGNPCGSKEKQPPVDGIQKGYSTVLDRRAGRKRANQLVLEKISGCTIWEAYRGEDFTDV